MQDHRTNIDRHRGAALLVKRAFLPQHAINQCFAHIEKSASPFSAVGRLSKVNAWGTPMDITDQLSHARRDDGMRASVCKNITVGRFQVQRDGQS